MSNILKRKDGFVKATEFRTFRNWYGSLRAKLVVNRLQDEHHVRMIELGKDEAWVHPALANELGWTKQQPPQQPVKAKAPNKLREKSVQAQIASQYNGQIEVETPVGFIDVLTPTMIIEIKEASKWKHALGQILSYAVYYPTREKWICLFGELDRKHVVEFVCTKYNIQVMYTQSNTQSHTTTDEK
jgi:hypothetical protein